MERTAFHKTAPAVPGASEVTGSLAAAVLKAPAMVFDGLLAWQRQSEERAQLRRLTDHQLRDMGLTREAAEEMARKPLWTRGL